jgi:hypothetical protein
MHCDDVTSVQVPEFSGVYMRLKNSCDVIGAEASVTTPHTNGRSKDMTNPTQLKLYSGFPTLTPACRGFFFDFYL